MLNRLRSLPLTIILTLLIWMYAEAQVRSPAQPEDSYTFKDVPVLVIGPANLLNDYIVNVRPLRVAITVTGPRDRIATLRNSAFDQNGDNPAYLILTPNDQHNQQPAGTMRAVTFMPGERDLTVQQPPEVTFWLVDKNKAATQTAP